MTVLERDEPGGGTSRVAAGMLAPIAEADINEQPLLRLGVAQRRDVPGVRRGAAPSRPARDPGYLECGSLLTARDRDEAESLDREQAVRERLELPVSRLLPGGARALEPALAPALRLALEVPDDHAIDPRALIAALVPAAERAGVSLRCGALVERGRVCRLRMSPASSSPTARARGADHVVIAAGPCSGAIAGLPDHARVPVRPVKGQIMRLHDPAGPGLLTRVLRMRPAYIVPRGDGRYVLGATMEERGFDTTVTAGAMYELLRDAIELVPGISELVIDELRRGSAARDAGQRAADRSRARCPACTGRPATSATGSCSRRSPPSWSSTSVLGDAQPSPFSPDRFAYAVHA